MIRDIARTVGLSSRHYRKEVSARTPLGRLGQPEEVAEAVCFLASPMASFVTGQVRRVAGGPRRRRSCESNAPSYRASGRCSADQSGLAPRERALSGRRARD